MEEPKPSCLSLKIDEACLNISSTLKAYFSMQYNECEQCTFLEPEPVSANTYTSFVIDTKYPVTLLIEAGNASCSQSLHMLEHGLYDMQVSPTGSTCNNPDLSESCLNCVLSEKSDTSRVTTYIPIIVAACIYFSIVLIYLLILALYKKFHAIFNRITRRDSLKDSLQSSADITSSPPSSPSSNELNVQENRTKKKRLRSLDTFRGISVATMIFVNYGGGKYWFFHHARWNGLTLADLVFPWFIWIMGVSMTMSLRSLIRRGIPKTKISWKIVKRTLILFALGIILNTSYGANDLKKLRVPGVLQRFAISYFVVGFVHMFFSRSADSHTERKWAPVRDIILYWGEWLIMLSLLAVHLCLTFFLPVPGCPTGYLGPGGLHQNSSYFNCTGGASGYIDRVFFGEEHMYGRPTCKEIYRTVQPYDPEGILGSITSIFLVFLGLQAGKILQTYTGWKERVGRWVAWGVVLGLLAALLCKGSKDDGWIPVNKNLWSLSFILTTGSFAFLLLSFCYFLQDVKGFWNGSPFFYPGMNSILLYIGHQLTTSLFPWQFKVPTSHAAELAMDLWGASLWVFISYVLYKKKIFLAI